MDMLDPQLPADSGEETTQTKDTKVAKRSRLFTEYYGSMVFVMFAFFLVISFGFLKPIIDHVKDANAQTTTSLTTADNERAFLASLDRSISAAKSIPPLVLDQVVEALPNDPNTPSLLVQFDAAAVRNNVRIISVSINEPKLVIPTTQKTTGPQVFPMDINLSIAAKNYFDMKRFLGDLETSLRVMDPAAISTGGIVEGGDITFTLQLKTYVFAQPVSAPRAGAPVQTAPAK